MAAPAILTIPTHKGPQHVEAKAVRGVWAIHRPLEWPAKTTKPADSGWNVTHIPSGARALHCQNLATARAVIAALPQHEKLLGAEHRAQLQEVADAIKALHLAPGDIWQQLPKRAAQPTAADTAP